MQRVVEAHERNSVTLDAKGVIVITMRGKQSAASIREIARRSTELSDAQRRAGKKVLVLADSRGLGLSDVPSDARVEAKKMMDPQGDTRTALLSDSRLAGVNMYLNRLGGRSHQMRFFMSERTARAWLLGHEHKGPGRSSASLAAGLSLLLIGIWALAGWQTGNAYFTSWIPHTRPMNPMAALGLIAAGIGFCAYWFNRPGVLRAVGCFGVLFGLAALLPTHIDYLLFSSKVHAAGTPALVASSAALCFIALGLSPFTVTVQAWWRRPVQYLLALILLGLGVVNLFGQLYAPDALADFSATFAMPINLSIAFVIAGLGMVLLVIYRKTGQTLAGRISWLGWLLVAALLLVQAATYGAWTQAVDRNTADSAEAFARQASGVQTALEERVSAYINALHGFRGLFAASDYVDQGEFESYYDSLNLAKNYPGLRALSFISRVNEKDVSAFIARHKADRSLNPGGNPNFALTNESPVPVHYLVTYVVDAPATAGGSDLASQPSRLQAFQRAEISGQPVSSGTVQFAASGTAPASRGFFLTTPVVSKGGTTITGFVNAVFGYDQFFAKAFTGGLLPQNASLRVVDTADSSQVFRTKMAPLTSDHALIGSPTMDVADHKWQLQFSAAGTFGISREQASMPRYILLGGQLFSALLIVIFVIMLRTRRQGYLLAESLTEDLERERNTAVANDQKNTAILSSIGDAVFAIDNQRRILLFNPAAQHISGFHEAEVLGKQYDEVLHFELEKSGKVNRKFIGEALSGRLASMSNHTMLIRKDGSRVPVADSAAPIHDAHGHIQGAIVVFRYVSTDYELDKAKTEFVSLASHQLRTPLSAINWYGEMLLSGDAGHLNKAQKEYVHEIFEGNQRMVELVNSLLDVSRLEVGKLPDKPQATSMAELVDSLEKELATIVTSKEQTLTKHIDKLPPVYADPKQLRMVVQNLMSNAVKYTPAKGAVTVTLRHAGAADVQAADLAGDEPRLFFSVQDTGYGIPKAQQSKIFGKLFRADNVRALDTEGTGLGLYIVKEVVEKMGGRVWFDSIESVGTTFFVVLPLGKEKTKK